MTELSVSATREVLASRARSRRLNGPSSSQRLEALYTAALGVAVLGSMVASGAAGLLEGTACSPTLGCLDPAGRPALAAAVLLAGFGLLWRAAVTLGPVGGSRAEVTWLLSTPADRRTLLLPALARAVAVAVGCGALLGWVVLAAATTGERSATWLGSAVLTGVLAAVAMTAAAVARQPSRSGPASPAGARIALAVAASCAVAALVPAALPVGLVANSAPWPGLAWLLPALAAAAAVGALVVAVRRLGSVALPELRGAGDAQEGVRGSVLLLDAGYAGTRLRGRRRRRGRLRSRRGAGRGLLALLFREAQVMVLRRPAQLLGTAALVVVPVLVLSLAGPLPTGLLVVLLAMRVAGSAAASLSTVDGSGGLARALPFPAPQTAAVLLAVPFLVVLAWSAAVAASLGWAPWAAVALALTAVAGVLRSTSPGAAGGELGPLVMTDSGPVPVGLAASLVRGPDVALLAAVPLLLGTGPLLALGVPVLAVAALLARRS